MQILELDSKLRMLYNEFLNKSSGNMLYYSLPYKKLLEDFLKCSSYYLVAYDRGKVYGILPLMYRKGKYGEVLNSLPFYGSHGGILASNKEAKLSLIEVYNSLIKNFASSNYVANLFLDNTQGILYDYKDYRIGQWSKLISEPFELFSSSARGSVLKAKREGVEIRKSKEVNFLFQTHYNNISRLNGIAKERSFFEKIAKYFQWDKEFILYEAIYQERRIAALLVFCYGGMVEYYTPATLFEYRTLQGLPLLIFNAMKEAYSKGYKMWNWGGTWNNQEGVYKFKKRLGAIDKKYEYLIKINNKEILNLSKEELLREYPYFYVIPFERLK